MGRCKHEDEALRREIGIANLSQRIDFSDWDLKAAGGEQPGKLRQDVCGGGFKAPFRLHPILSRGGEIDDRVDSVRSDAQLQCKFDVPSTECVNDLNPA